MKHLLQLAAVWACIAARASAAEVALREHAVPAGSIIRLGDVATISADDGMPTDHLAATPLMPAPPMGSTQYLRVSELRDLLSARGIDVRGMRLTGADVVAIGAAAPGTVELSTAPRSLLADVEAAAEKLTVAIVDYLRQQTGHDLWSVKVDADADVVAAFTSAGSRAAVSGGKAPWSGRQRFMISGGAGTQGATAYARVERLDMAAFAARPIERGELIRRTDVELRPHAGALPKQAILSMESLIGKEAIQSIHPDSLVLTNQIRSPLMVRRGERVSVRVRAAGVSVRTYAVAQQDGSVGDLVAVQSLEGKERFSARVAGLRELEILAAGASAVDVASATSPELR